MTEVTSNADSSISLPSIVSTVPYDTSRSSPLELQRGHVSRSNSFYGDDSSMLSSRRTSERASYQLWERPNEYLAFSNSQEHFLASLGAFSRDSSENDSKEAELSNKSDSSGITIYSDAQESVKDELSRAEEHVQSIRSSQGYGLITVTPLKSTFKGSVLSAEAVDFGAENANEASVTSYAASPGTPQLRRPSSDRHVQEIPSNIAKKSSDKSDQNCKRIPQEQSPTLKKVREPLGSLYNKSLFPHDNTNILPKSKYPENHAQWSVVRSTRELIFSLGRLRVVSVNSSIASTHGSNKADAAGHIEPSRKVKEPELSYVRRVRELIHTEAPLYAGMPRVPYFPLRSERLRQFNEKRDIWGRKVASRWVSISVMCACLFFPPLWLLLAVGYLDHVFGPISRLVKIMSFLLSLATLAAGTALVVVVSVSRYT